MQNVRVVAAIAGIVALLSIVGLAQQSPAQQTRAQRAPEQQTDINETQLRSFARVFVQIEKIIETYAPQMNQAKTPEEGQKLQTEETSKIEQALREQGMDAQSFHRIVQLADADEGLHAKIETFINEERQKIWA